VLVIRFNSIGDIVLTSPTVKALHDAGYEIHFLVKSAFKSLVEPNPHITKVWNIEKGLAEVIPVLKKEGYHKIVDLHNNLRSRQVKAALRISAHTLKKPRIKLLLLTQTNFRTEPQAHIVDRFLSVLEPMGISVPQPKTAFYFSKIGNKPLLDRLPKKFLCIAVGAAWATKEIPISLLNLIVEKTSYEQVVLIGGPADVERSQAIEPRVGLMNLTGTLDIEDSARVIENSQVLLTGDTGMMHIAAALSIPIVAIFGSTHPMLGYTPHRPILEPANAVIIQNNDLDCRPCTKQGKTSCPKGHFRCMTEINPQEVINALESYL